MKLLEKLPIFGLAFFIKKYLNLKQPSISLSIPKTILLGTFHVIITTITIKFIVSYF